MTEPKDIAASTHTVRVAAVQIAGRVGDLADNLQQAEALATEALARGAKVVVLPEFFTTPCYVHQRLHEAIVGLDNPAKDMLVRLARQHGAAGLAVCWELVRWRKIRRLTGRVRFAITGNQWWTVAEN